MSPGLIVTTIVLAPLLGALIAGLTGRRIGDVASQSVTTGLLLLAFALFVLTVAAAEAAIGLAILVVYFRNRGTIAVEDVNVMKG